MKVATSYMYISQTIFPHSSCLGHYSLHGEVLPPPSPLSLPTGRADYGGFIIYVEDGTMMILRVGGGGGGVAIFQR